MPGVSSCKTSRRADCMSEMCFSSLALHFRMATLGGKRQRMHWMILDGSGVAVKERVASCNVVFFGGPVCSGWTPGTRAKHTARSSPLPGCFLREWVLQTDSDRTNIRRLWRKVPLAFPKILYFNSSTFLLFPSHYLECHGSWEHLSECWDCKADEAWSTGSRGWTLGETHCSALLTPKL